ncbi:MAG: hypothetical protein ACUVQF_03720 [Fervidobacterium sp.]|uniref:hypothetical protein n=1 Tax=Fervidobacterium sp. TaxID=1871331 RepID=UPI00404B199C
MDFNSINTRISEIINTHTELEKKLFIINQGNNYLISLNEILDELSDMISEVSEKVEDWFDYVSDLADNMDDWLEEFYDMVDQFIDMAQNSIDQVDEYDKDYDEDYSEDYDFEETADRIVSVFDDWEKLFSQLIELVETGNNKVVEMFSTVSKLQNEVDDQSLSNMKQLVSRLVDWKKRIELAVSDFERWKDFVEKQVEDFEDFHENLKDAFE